MEAYRRNKKVAMQALFRRIVRRVRKSQRVRAERSVIGGLEAKLVLASSLYRGTLELTSFYICLLYGMVYKLKFPSLLVLTFTE